jgi:2-keto-myo-inositol isomerase
MASVELFRPEYYKMSAEDTIRTAREKSIKALSPYWPLS